MKKIKILYVEDEIFLAKIVGETLQSRGYDVVMEADGAKALEVFNREKPDVCILDIMLPGKDGFMIADEIREKNAQVPIIFLSAKSQTSDVVNGFKMGANDYIRKPFSMEELIVRVENVVKNKSAPPEEVEEIIIGKYVFNSCVILLINSFLISASLLCLKRLRYNNENDRMVNPIRKTENRIGTKILFNKNPVGFPRSR